MHVEPRSDRSGQKVTVVDLGVGNIGSMVNMLRRVGARVDVVSEPGRIGGSDRLVLPGVGSWDNAVAQLDRGFREALSDAVLGRGVPLLGVCLGMQMLMHRSDEGDRTGLGWIPGVVRRFDFRRIGTSDPVPKVPHMGWNLVSARRGELFSGLDAGARFYFVHSYHAAELPEENVAMTAFHGYEFVCGVNREHIWGVQFHPEKSHHFGMRLLGNFLGLTC